MGRNATAMKFSNLKLGQKFLYKGMELEKSGPLQAVEKTSGTERLIMRSAPVELLTSARETGSGKVASLDELRQRLADYHQTCIALLRAAEAESEPMQAAYRNVQQSVEQLALLINRTEHPSKPGSN
jgi:hypothetical protein